MVERVVQNGNLVLAIVPVGWRDGRVLIRVVVRRGKFEDGVARVRVWGPIGLEVVLLEGLLAVHLQPL